METKKQFLSLILLGLLCSVGSVWADDEFTTLRTVDFTAMTKKTDFADGKNTISDAGYTDLEFYQKNSSKPLKLNNSTGEGIDFSGQNIGNSHFVAIPITGINGKLKVTIYHKYNSNKASFKLGLKTGTTTVTPGDYSTNAQTSADAANADVTNSYTYGTDIISTATTAVLFVGEAGTSYTQIKKVVIETLASGPTALTGAWSDATPVFAIGSVATIPTFSVTGGTLGTDYSVAYSIVSGSLATVNSLTGITAINTSAVGTATVRATVNVINTGKYEIDPTTYDCVINVNTTHTVTYDGNGSTGGSVPTDASSPYVEGLDVTVLGNTGSLEKTGYTFIGWNTKADGSGSAYSAGNTFRITENVTLYAQWIEGTATTITYKFTCSTSEASLALTSATPSGDGASSLTAGTSVTSTASLSDVGKSNSPVRTCKIEAPTSKSKYVEFTFTVASGKQMYITAMNFGVLTVGSSNYQKQSYEAVITDGLGRSYIGTLSGITNNVMTAINFPSLGYVSGNVSIKIYAWNTAAADTYRMQQDNIVTGIVSDFPSSVTGTITSIGWNTYASPYPLDLSSISGGTAYYASAKDIENSIITLSPTTASIPAGEGILIKGTAGETFTINTAASGSLSGNLLVGVVANNTSVSSPYVLAGVEEDGETPYFQQYNGSTMNANKAYLPSDVLSGAAGRIRFIIEEESNATNITNLEATNEAVKFIKDGQLFIKKNGVVYDAMGRAIR